MGNRPVHMNTAHLSVVPSLTLGLWFLSCEAFYLGCTTPPCDICTTRSNRFRYQVAWCSILGLWVGSWDVKAKHYLTPPIYSRIVWQVLSVISLPFQSCCIQRNSPMECTSVPNYTLLLHFRLFNDFALLLDASTSLTENSFYTIYEFVHWQSWMYVTDSDNASLLSLCLNLGLHALIAV